MICSILYVLVNQIFQIQQERVSELGILLGKVGERLASDVC